MWRLVNLGMAIFGMSSEMFSLNPEGMPIAVCPQARRKKRLIQQWFIINLGQCEAVRERVSLLWKI